MIRLFRLSLLFLCFSVASPVQAQAPTGLNQRYVALQKRLELNPEDVRSRLSLAFLYSQGFEFQRAIEEYETVLKNQPDQKQALTELCVLNTQIQNQGQAAHYCTRLTEVSSENPLVWDNLGLSYLKLGQPEKSLQPFLRALERDSNSVLIAFHLSQAWRRLGWDSLSLSLLQNLQKRQKLSDSDKVLVNHGLYLLHTAQREYSLAFDAIVRAYEASHTGLFLGKVIRAWMRAHQIVSFLVFALLVLGASHYLGKRLNRFLKNDLSDLE